jgi:hypothetical protein
MATGSGAFPAKAGFNQSGGHYLMVLEATATMLPKLNTYTGGSGSGGATTVGTFSTATWTAYGANNVSSLFANGKLVRDMGKTVVSAGRSFRKIQAVVENGVGASYGVTGLASGTLTTADAGYVSYYVETGREGTAPASNIPVLVRFM